MARLVLVSLGLLCLVASHAAAQPYPVSGNVYLSFHPQVQDSERDVLPGEIFDLYIAFDIPVDGQNPMDGIVGVEGGVTIPPQLELVETAIWPPAINLGPSFREPDLESFIVGLGECIGLGPRHTIGAMTFRLVADASDVEISVTAPSVGAAAISSFAGLGPGWAVQDCSTGEGPELVLFETPGSGPGSRIVVNPSAIPNASTGLTTLKARYGS
jgi:hypothetical protein